MDIKQEIIYPEDTVQVFMKEEQDIEELVDQVFMKEEQDIEDCTNIKQENVGFQEEFDEKDIKQEENLFVKEEFKDRCLGTSLNKKEKITCLGCHREFVNLTKHFGGTKGTICKQKYLENLDNSNEAFEHTPIAIKRKTIFGKDEEAALFEVQDNATISPLDNWNETLVHIQKASKRKIEIDEYVFCKGCNKPFQTLLAHLNRKTGQSCREFYGPEVLQPPSKQKRYNEKNKERLKQIAKESYQKNKEARKKQMKETYQKNRESRKNQMKENYMKKKLLTMKTIDVIKEDDNDDEIDKDNGEDDSDDEENVFAKKDVSVETYQKNREARKKQMKENYQKNKVVRKQKMKENIKRKLLIMNTIDDMKEDDNDDELYKDSGEDDSDDEEDVFAKEDVTVAFGNQIQGISCEEVDKGVH